MDAGITRGQTAEYWIRALGLVPHPEGGHWVQTYRAREEIDASGPPSRFGAARPCSTAIYFLLRSGEYSAFHRLKADELWHFYAGGPLTLWIIDEGGELVPRRLGPHHDRGQSFQVAVPARSWFGATVDDPGTFTLVGCTVAPGFDFADFELGDRETLLRLCPQHRAVIERLTR